MPERQPLSPAEFDAALRRLVKAHPQLSETSGYRSADRNAQVGGNPLSKHRLGMARDYVGSMALLRLAQRTAHDLGLWYLLHDAGSGDHLHVQGLPPGEVPAWWRAKYLEG